MDKALYIHGLGGSGSGKSATNVKKALEGLYEVEAETYDLLQPLETFNRLKADIKSCDIIIASSLGGFYASALPTNKVVILLNPCLNPKKEIPKILYPEQREHYDEEMCFEQWDEIADNWEEFDTEVKAAKFGVFSNKDEYFSYKREFENLFSTSYGRNFCSINGTHEIAKDYHQLLDALSQGFDYLEKINGVWEPGRMNEARLQETWLNMFFNSGDPRQEEKIRKNIREVWELLDKAYAYLTDNERGRGGPGGFKNITDFYVDCKKSNAMIKAVRKQGKIVAAAVYNLKRGGRKLSLIGADCKYIPNKNKWVATPEGKKGLYTIAKEDIEQGDRHFWGEVSDGAETVYYVKTKAMPIPPSVVEALMPDKDIQATDDHLPIRHMKKVIGKEKDKYGNDVPIYDEWDEENRFDSGYYERPIIGKMHRKVAVTSPENVDKVATFDKILYNRKK